VRAADGQAAVGRPRGQNINHFLIEFLTLVCEQQTARRPGQAAVGRPRGQSRRLEQEQVAAMPTS
jgi:hypothetical protein